MQIMNTKRCQLFLAIAAASFGLVPMASLHAQDAVVEDTQAATSEEQIDAPVVEEMLITGRQQTAAQAIVSERIEQAYAVDIIGDEQISRAGDSNIAIALTRVTGVTLMDGKYVYVRSLGERYSSTLLNGAAVPSPELSRNVLPLDLIPSSIVETLKVQKAYSPELPANFGGGSVDIRTKTVPEEFVFSIAMGTGMNTESKDGLTHASHGESFAMPDVLRYAIDTYQGNLSINNIWDTNDTNGGSATVDETKAATQINRDLLVSLNRNVEIRQKSLPADFSGNLTIGNNWGITDDVSLGAVVNFSQDSKWRNKDQKEHDIGSPETNYADTQRTIEETRQLGSLNVGLNYQDMHKFQASVYHIEHIHDEARITKAFTNSFTLASGDQQAEYDTRLEERELNIGQLTGEHKFDQLNNDHLDTLVIDWFYSDSKVKTSVPNHTTISVDNKVDPTSGALISSQLSPRPAMAQFEFLNLEDDVLSHGWNVKVPLIFGNWKLNLSGGYSYNDKTREYYGYTANVDATNNQSSVLTGNVSQVLSNANLSNLNNKFELTVGGGFGTESYIAAQITEGAYGMFDVTWNDTWRITGGARKETFKQALLPLDLLDYKGTSLLKLIDKLDDEDQKYAFMEDDWYPSLAITYMNEGFMNTEAFQVRLSASETVVRPDLREMSDVTYLDTELGRRVKGNSSLVFSSLQHYDLRGEWFFESGNNLTLSLFYKDIEDPIESTQIPGSDNDVILTFENSLSGEIYGLEIEALRNIGAGFFVSSNLTLSDSEIISPEGLGYTNAKRPMTGQSDYVLNLQLGFDSEDEKHSASLVYNLFGERLYYSARSGGNSTNTSGSHDDAYEQPFNSLDLTYSYYPTENISTRIKLGNILNEKRVLGQVNSNGKNVEIIKQEVGTSIGVEAKYKF